MEKQEGAGMEIELSELHAAQREIVDSTARFKVLICGRRFGKTAACIDILVNRIMDGQSCAYFAPTFRMASEVWREMKNVLLPMISDGAENEWRLEFGSGGLLECWSLSNQTAETVRGRKYHYVVIDEAALIPTGDIWHSAIRPLLTDYEGGALFASTPRGRNWLWPLFLQGQSRDYPDWESWRYPTAANPFIKGSEIAAARRGMPERYFQQEYEAMFLDDGGVVFRNIDAVCVNRPHLLSLTFTPPQISDPLPLTPSPLRSEGEQEKNDSGFGGYGYGETYFFGVDWGKDHDFTCVSVMTREGKQVYLERFNQIGWAVQRGRLASLYERFKPHVILAEANSIGSVNIEALQAEGLPVQGFMTTRTSKGPLIEGLALAMERSEITLLHDPVLMQELMTYGMTRSGNGWQYGAPAGAHDDTVIATALSLWASQRSGRVGIDFV
jgi:hypothetical protein